ncbi:hypothetical protein [uncultured Chitinophaga sp.]|uniref:hypothetical protein n=1 Tax=uncultured Chitinophaga sp. TaxID=339340 RepID=UPI0025F4C70D|nr:hypothetical protein [uncultured Chitinophaga sp.]
MKLCFSIWALTALSLAACNQPVKTEGHEDSVTVTANTPAKPAGPGCYQLISGQDSFRLDLQLQGDSASGTLVYNFFEKDDSKGTFKGLLTDSILKIAYEFSSEGIISTRPAIFKLTDGQAFEARPDTFTQTGLPVFPDDRSKLVFDTTPWRQNCGL